MTIIVIAIAIAGLSLQGLLDSHCLRQGSDWGLNSKIRLLGSFGNPQKYRGSTPKIEVWRFSVVERRGANISGSACWLLVLALLLVPGWLQSHVKSIVSIGVSKNRFMRRINQLRFLV